MATGPLNIIIMPLAQMKAGLNYQTFPQSSHMAKKDEKIYDSSI